MTTILLNTNATPIRSHQDYGYTCCFCDEAYVNPADLKEHTITKHNTQEKKNFVKGKRIDQYVAKLDITALTCKICDSNVDDLEKMMSHLKDHGEKIHLDINNHIISFKFDNQELRCVNCKQLFNTFKILYEHMNRHSKNYVCDICGSGYVNQKSFNTHYSSHEKGTFPCEHCSKVFETKRRRSCHEIAYHRYKWNLWKCGFCGEKFGTSFRKMQHIAVIHGQIMKKVECQLCHKMCSSVNALRVHTKRDHLKERPYSCDMCSMKFFTKSGLKDHMVKHTGVGKFQCDVCKKSYRKKLSLREHMRIHDPNDRRYKFINIDPVNSETVKVQRTKKKIYKKYTREAYNKSIEDVRTKKLTQTEAALKYNIPRRTISSWFMRHPEINEGTKKDNLEMSLEVSEKKLQKMKTIAALANINTDNSETANAQRTEDKSNKKYTREEFNKCIEDVRNNKFTQKEAALHYNIPRQTINSWIRRHPVITEKTKDSLEMSLEVSNKRLQRMSTIAALAETNAETENSETVKTQRTENKNNKKYTQQEFNKCIMDILNKKLTKTEAILQYNIPRQTINSWLIRHPDIDDKTLKEYLEMSLEDRNKILKEATAALARTKFNSTANPRLKDTKIRTTLKKNLQLLDSSPGNEILKHGDNMTTILLNTNATPIRSHQDYGYTCCFCDEAYVNPADLKEHTITKHNTQEKKNFIKGKHLSQYVAKLDITALTCKICDSNVDDLEKMMSHLKDHGEKMHLDINNHIISFKFDNQELRCVICKQLFNTFKILYEHMNRHSKNYVCDICGSGYVNQNSFNTHYSSHEKGTFPCEHCSKVFETKQRRRCHEVAYHRYKWNLWKCGFCGEKFGTRHRKMQHIVAVHGQTMKKVECQLCHKMCNSVNALRIHTKRDHLQERRYSCDVCSMKFFTNVSLKCHMLKHTGVKKFQCGVCDKSFSRKYTLLEHMRIHTNDRRFKCEHCEMSFIQKCSLIAHIKSKHGGSISEE